MREVLRRALWLSGLLWALGWFGLYLEVYRWHHVTPSLRLNGPPASPGTSPPHPGMFLITVLVSSALAPPVFVVLLLGSRRWGRRAVTPQPNGHWGLSAATPLMAFGITMVILGTINVLLHESAGRPEIDLTMRRGNGGFIVNGAALCVLGFALKRFGVRRRDLTDSNAAATPGRRDGSW